MKFSSVPFLKAVEDVTGGNIKIQCKDYQQIGHLPVIDQGQEEVAGYTDNLKASFQGSLPVILFGDHTRIFKYVDKPFALGADGIKVLAPKNGFNAKFIYYYLRSCDIPSRGYSRHFKFLKEIEIPVFALSEQNRMVEILDEADRLRRLRREADAKAARILSALFLKMFGDPGTNPRGWIEKPLREAIATVEAGWSATSEARLRQEHEFGVLKVSAVTSGRFLAEEHKAVIDVSETRTLVCPRRGDLLFSRANTRELVAASCIVDVDHLKLFLSDKLWRLTPRDRVASTLFLKELFWNDGVREKFRVASSGSSGSMLNISQEAMLRTIVPMPPYELQMKFEAIAWRLMEIIDQARNAASKIDSIWETLMQRTFSGQLTVKWREAHSKELLAEMEQQARLLNLPLPKELETTP